MLRLNLVALLLLTPVLAGCFADEAAPAAAEGVAANAAEAGAVDGPAPSAAKNPYQAQASTDGAAEAVTIYPVSIQTNAPKSPYTEQFSGVFQPYQCLPTGGGLPLGGLGLARGTQFFEVTEAFATNDVFSFDLSLSFVNTDQSWAELHLWHQFDDVGNYWNEPVSDGRGEIVQNFTGQGFIVNEEFWAGVGVDCWFGVVTSPIAYTLTLTVTFAEGAVPSQVPVLLEVPADATRLFVTGLALDDARGVTSHFRVFAPDDSLVCECALSSNEEVTEVELVEPGDYVILVDHTENGFVAFGLDAASQTPLRPLGTRWERFPLAASDGGRVDETLQVEFASTPLGVFAWVFAPGQPFQDPPNVGGGHNVKITVSNARGDVLRMGLVGYFTYHARVEGFFGTNDWYAIPLDGEWEFFTDHHAYDLGGHTVTVKAEQMRGHADLFAMFYDRASA